MYSYTRYSRHWSYEDFAEEFLSFVCRNTVKISLINMIIPWLIRTITAVHRRGHPATNSTNWSWSASLSRNLSAFYNQFGCFFSRKFYVKHRKIENIAAKNNSSILTDNTVQVVRFQSHIVEIYAFKWNKCRLSTYRTVLYTIHRTILYTIKWNK